MRLKPNAQLLEGLRIGLVTDNPLSIVGGVERFSYNLVNELSRRGAQVIIYDQTMIHKEFLRERWYDHLGLKMVRRTWILGIIAAEALKRDGIDIIIQNGISGWPLRNTAREIPRIVVHHGTWRGVAPHLVKSKAPLRTRIANRIFTRCELGAIEKWTSIGAVSVGVSTAVAEELKKLYGLSAKVIQNGVDLNHFAPRDRLQARQLLRLAIQPDNLVVSFVGRLEEMKGIDILRTIVLRAEQEFPNMLFLVATDNPPRDWPKNIMFLSNVSYEQMPLVYSASDIFLFPSRYEGCSYSVIEAMACGIAPILSKVGHAKDICQEDKLLGEFILDELTPDAFWKCLCRLVGDNKLRHDVGLSARRYVERHNSLESMGDAYQDLIMPTLIKKKGKGR